MTLAISLRGAARSLINKFGNTVSIYTYSTATKTENSEGDISVTSWGTASPVYAVDGDNAKAVLTQATQGIETIGEDEKIFRDDATIAVNDRITSDSVNYKVVSIRPVRTQNTLVIQIVQVIRVTNTTNW
jgi:hypothetical protein